jgi:hypothetical protein
MYIIIAVIGGTLVLIGIVAYFIKARMKKDSYEGEIIKMFDEVSRGEDYDETYYYLLVQTTDGTQRKVQLPKKRFEQFSMGEQIIKVQGESWPKKK